MATKVQAITCSKCGDTIFSRAGHDYRSCSCGDVAIDGGRGYTKVAYHDSNNPPEAFEMLVEATEQELYDDWNTRADRFGRLPKGVWDQATPEKE